jgi:hypothetical protein
MQVIDKKQEAKIEFINEKGQLSQTNNKEALPIQNVNRLLDAAEIVQEIMEGNL